MQRFLHAVIFLIMAASFVFLVLSVIHWFDIRYFLSMIFCWGAVWILWPEDALRRDKQKDDNGFWDLLDLILELPFVLFSGIFRVIAVFFRAVGRFLDF